MIAESLSFPVTDAFSIAEYQEYKQTDEGSNPSMPIKQVTSKGSRFDITISGDSASEIVKDYVELSKELEQAIGARQPQNHPRTTGTRKSVRPGTPGSLSDDVSELVSEGFFDTPKTLGQVKDALAAKGIIKPVTTLSGVMQELVKRKVLSRERQTIGKKQVWAYRKLS